MEKIILPKMRSHAFSALDNTIFSTRVRLARNIEALPFPAYLPQAQKIQIEDQFSDILSKTDSYSSINSINISKYNKKQILNMEKDLIITEEFTEFGDIFFFDKNAEWIFLPNEKDHIRIFGIDFGSKAKPIYKRISEIVNSIEEKIHFSYHSEFGYTTAYANNAGNALSVSYLLNLAALEMSNLTSSLATLCQESGYQLQPFHGLKNSQLYFFKNISSFGISELELIDKMQEFLNKIHYKEQEVKEELLSKNGDHEFLIEHLLHMINQKNINQTEVIEVVALTEMLCGFSTKISNRDEWRALIFRLHSNSSIFNSLSSNIEEIAEYRAQLLQQNFKKLIKITT